MADNKSEKQEFQEVSKQRSAHPQRAGPLVITEGMIKLKRRFDYRTRLRPNAIAIVDPSTRSVLYPGKKPEETTSDAADKPQDTGAQKVEEESENGQMQQFNQPNIQQRYSFQCNYLQNGVMTSQGLAPAYPFYMFEQHPVSYYDLPFYSHQ